MYEHRLEPLLPARSAAASATDPAPATVVGTAPETVLERRPDVSVGNAAGERRARLAERVRGADGHVMTGAVASRFTVTVAVCDPPRLVAVQVKVVPGVSAEIVTVAHPVVLATGDSGSAVVNATVTSRCTSRSGRGCP